jgi:hypothetical protein
MNNDETDMDGGLVPPVTIFFATVSALKGRIPHELYAAGSRRSGGHGFSADAARCAKWKCLDFTHAQKWA